MSVKGMRFRFVVRRFPETVAGEKNGVRFNGRRLELQCGHIVTVPVGRSYSRRVHCDKCPRF